MGETEELLEALGLRSVEELFADIPRPVRVERLDLPPGRSELEMRREFQALLGRNRPVSDHLSFLGAGLYQHFIPAAVKTIVGRSEFYSSYTPYQPEISQGMLQALFEYQSLIAELTGLEAVNSSMYDGATAAGEAALMAARISGGDRFLVSRAVSPERRGVLQTYARGPGLRVEEVAYDPQTGEVELDSLRSLLGPDVAGFYFETPNFFGVLDRRGPEIRSMLGQIPLVAGVNPLALALVQPPGEFGADIVVGEGQPLGLPLNMGGPHVGIFACRQEHVRKMPGRVIGLTADREGRRAFCMTLQTREQHIRRSKATSNICTNEALLAVAIAAHLALLGGSGLRRIAAINIAQARSLAARLAALRGVKAPLFDAPHFNEFVARFPRSPEEINRGLLAADIQGGYSLERAFPELGSSMLLATTEVHTEADHLRLVETLEGLL